MGGEINTQDLLAQYQNAQEQNGNASGQSVPFGYGVWPYPQPQHCGYCPCCGRKSVWGAWWPYPYYYGPTWVGAGTSLQAMASGGMHVGQTESEA